MEKKTEIDVAGVYHASDEDIRETASWLFRNIEFWPVRPMDGNYNRDYYH